MSRPEVVVVAARRTWIGSMGRGHAGTDAAGLAAPVLRAVHDDAAPVLRAVRDAAVHDDAGLDDAGLDDMGPDDAGPGTRGACDDVVLGSSAGPGGNVARAAALGAGLGAHVPGLTVDRQCASGLAAVLVGAQAVRDGARAVLAGGVESPSTAPARAHRTPGGLVPFDRARFTPEGWDDPDMGPAADAVARERGVGRARQDAYAVRSHARALAAHTAGRFAAETVGVPGARVPLDRDEHVRALDLRLAARLRPAFGGTATAASSAPVSDGAAAVVLVPGAARAAAGVPGLRLVAGAVRASDPRLPGLSPVPAVEAALAAAGCTVRDLAVVEVVEAFAGQVLAVTDALGLDPLGADDARVCPAGGAIALGHPWGASGAVAVVRLFTELVRGGAPAGTLGLATVAAGGGVGVAAVLEVVR
ncbi:acetyl-CoA C-acetyltransferase [Sediminihabitans luteus]|uniref:Probable acetyl-CoA acetyltransferase n=1 Tax=Sediminihabitans luteus TaxID=1138585 RepID=A0A2M9CY58_9CELL|nr:thiolase family protein [Sediminihabitans luteus]PJJ76871.1 acetyl-CoA C-acetyltransferase [Sediminihabitans luteus]GIJ00352.1 hypothetical protein Slu03_27290 [Sediminihabitans luteus]